MILFKNICVFLNKIVVLDSKCVIIISTQTNTEIEFMYNHIVTLINKYKKIIGKFKKLNVGKKVRSSVFSALNKLRSSLSKLDKLNRSETNIKFKSDIAVDFIYINQFNNKVSVSKIITII